MFHIPAHKNVSHPAGQVRLDRAEARDVAPDVRAECAEYAGQIAAVDQWVAYRQEFGIAAGEL